MTTEPSDAELVGRAKRGELDAYEALVRRYQHLVTRVAFVITADLADAEDVAQEAFIKAYAALGRVEPQSFRLWLLRIVTNEARNFRKAAQRRANAQARASGEAGPAVPAPSPESAVVADEQRRVLLRALDGLREEDRLAIGYRYLFDLSETEMVEALGWPRGTVKSRLARALGRFRQEVGQLAILPPSVFALSHVAQQLASWSEADLEHGLSGLAAHLSGLPTHDLTAGLMPKLVAARAAHAGPWPHWSGPALALGGTGAAVIVAAAVAFGTLRQPEPIAIATPVPAAGAGIAPAPSPSPAAPRVIVVYAADLSDQDRAELSRVFAADAGTSAETISREEALSTLAAVGQPVSPDTLTLSSVRLDCPTPDGSLSVRTEHITMLPALTYATALLAADSTDVSVIAAAPAARPVTGETALVGMLRAAGRCTGHETQSAARVNLGYLVLGLTAQLSNATGNWTSAAMIMAQTVHAIVTGQAHDEAGVGSALEGAASASGVTLEADVRTQLASQLQSLVGQDYGPYGKGYRIEQESPQQARLVP